MEGKEINCYTCGKPVQFVWDSSEDRPIPESKYWHSYAPAWGKEFDEVFCCPECMLIRHTQRNASS